MLTGQHPFGSSDQLVRMVAVLREPYRPIGQLVPPLADWDAFFRRGLAQDLSQRFASAAEMAEALRQQAPDNEALRGRAGGRVATVAIPLSPPEPSAELGAGRRAVPTQISPEAHGGGMATQISGEPAEAASRYGQPDPLPIPVVTAPPLEAPQLVWWAVVLIAGLCLAVGTALGYLLGAG